MRGLKQPDGVLDCGNSGTTTRLLSGLLSAQPFSVTLTGDESIQKRPMNRIITPLSQMGASIQSMGGNGCAPLRIEGRKLHGNFLSVSRGLRPGKIFDYFWPDFTQTEKPE